VLPKITTHPGSASLSQICRIPLFILGVPSDLQAMEWARWDEGVRRPEAAISPRHYPQLLLTPM